MPSASSEFTIQVSLTATLSTHSKPDINIFMAVEPAALLRIKAEFFAETRRKLQCLSELLPYYSCQKVAGSILDGGHWNFFYRLNPSSRNPLIEYHVEDPKLDGRMM